MSPFFVKFAYKDSNKKVQITKDQLTWDHVCNILMKSFFMAEKDKIQLKYNDIENDEITVNSDKDLEEAYNLYFMKNLIKFFVHYSGVFEKDNSAGSFSGYSKIERPRSLTSVSLSQNELEKSRKTSENALVKPEKSAQAVSEVKEEVLLPKEPVITKVKIESDELISIFSQVFESTEILKKIQGKLATYIQKDEKQSDDIIEYSIETDYKVITDYMIENLNKLMNTKTEIQNEQLDKDSDKKENLEESKYEPIDTLPSRIELNKSNKEFLNVSLGESIYEPSTNLAYTRSIGKNRSFRSTSKSIESKDLNGSLGVKLVLKYENGKAKFVSIPISEYSFIEEVSSDKELNKIDQDEMVQPNIDESLNNVVLSLQKKASREGKPSEFSKRILKPNLHDLDDDLPAPYNVKIVQKFEKGLDNSVYEKIE